MVRYVSGDIFKSECDVLINPTNTMGVPGKGLALEFAKKYPEATQHYIQWCKSQRRKGGDVFTTFEKGKVVAFFCTKETWWTPSQIEWIERGCDQLAQHVPTLLSIAVPKLGTGLGKLSWQDVHPIIVKNLSAYDLEIYGNEP